MANTKTTALAAFTPVLADLLYGVDDPGGTPASGKLTITALRTLLNTTPGQQTIWIPASAMTPTTTAGATSGLVELASNDIMMNTLDFDTGSDEQAQFVIQMPKGWNEGTIIAQAVWSHPSTSVNFGVAWGIRSRAFANDDPLDTAVGGVQLMVDTGGTTNDIYISPESSAHTVQGSPGNEEFVVFEIFRDVSDAGDTLAVDARLHGIRLHYVTSDVTDD